VEHNVSRVTTGPGSLLLVILIPVPLTFIGIMSGQWLMGAPFTATALIGFEARAGQQRGASLYGCRANRDRRLLREDGDQRPCHASAHETGAVQGHFARLCQSGGLYLFAGASSSVNRPRVPTRLWTRGILVAPCFASRAVDQTRPLPPYSEPHSRLIEPERHACACLWIAFRRIQRAFNHASPRG
jgi:hypothetical protein